MMSLGVLNLPRLPVLDWAFGHSIVSCHVEHHLFPRLSDNMCLKVCEDQAGLVRGSREGLPCVRAAVCVSDQRHVDFLPAL